MFWEKLYRFIMCKASIFMLGISNVILEETRMVDDSRSQIEQQEIQSEETD